MPIFFNCILIKEAINEKDLVSIIEGNTPTLYLTSDLSDEPIGQLDTYKISKDWIKLKPKVFLPLIKNNIMVLSSIPGATNTGQCIQEKLIYDFFIQKEERKIPQNLRKVMSIDAAIETIKNKTLKFTPPSKFNDFQEGFASFSDLGYEPLDESGRPVEDYEQLIDKFYVSCFSEGAWNNLSLSIYGDKGKGVMLIFNGEKLEQSYGLELKPVKYMFNEPSLGTLDSDEKIAKALQAKHISWEYEKEWRFIQRKEGLCYTGNHLGDGSILLPFSGEALKYIYIGPKADPQKKQELLQTLLESGLNDHVKVYPIIKNNLKYNELILSFSPINLH